MCNSVTLLKLWALRVGNAWSCSSICSARELQFPFWLDGEVGEHTQEALSPLLRLWGEEDDSSVL